MQKAIHGGNEAPGSTTPYRRLTMIQVSNGKSVGPTRMNRRLRFAGGLVLLACLLALVAPCPIEAQTMTLEGRRNLCSQTASDQRAVARNTWMKAKNMGSDVHKEYSMVSGDLVSKEPARRNAAAGRVRAKEGQAFNEFMRAIDQYRLAQGTYQQCIGIEQQLVAGKYKSAFIPAFETAIRGIQEDIEFCNRDATDMRKMWSQHQWF
jgi:hypothetical protein